MDFTGTGTAVAGVIVGGAYPNQGNCVSVGVRVWVGVMVSIGDGDAGGVLRARLGFVGVGASVWVGLGSGVSAASGPVVS